MRAQSHTPAHSRTRHHTTLTRARCVHLRAAGNDDITAERQQLGGDRLAWTHEGAPVSLEQSTVRPTVIQHDVTILYMLYMKYSTSLIL